MAEAQAAPLEMHLAQCNRCALALQSLRPRDALTHGLQEARGVAGPSAEDTLVEALMQQLRGLRTSPGAPAPPLRGPADDAGGVPLGDFRIVREVGRGGMGVV